MGMFDEVSLRCPHCGEYSLYQSKAGDCVLGLHTIDTAPLPVLADLAEDVLICIHCGRSFELEIISTVRIIF